MKKEKTHRIEVRYNDRQKDIIQKYLAKPTFPNTINQVICTIIQEYDVKEARIESLQKTISELRDELDHVKGLVLKANNINRKGLALYKEFIELMTDISNME